MLTALAVVLVASRPAMGTIPLPSLLAFDDPVAAAVAAPVAAQNPAAPSPPKDPEQKEPPTPPHTGIRALVSGLGADVKHLPALPNLYIAASGGALAAGLHPWDDELNARLRGPQQAARFVFAPGKYVGNTAVQIGAALGVYGVGRAAHRDKVSHLGMDLLRAQIVTSALTTGVKYATQRERPDGSNQHSFPSGHASITFATATVIERHLGWRASALGYAAASYVAASRLHDNRHYLSDVVFGAAVGVIGGRTVTQHGRGTWTLVPLPVEKGVSLVVMRGP
ncbi:MAG: phosphatase PAP2 family protein [Acidobacteria bacterium]|nr:phosphatase PAP2 family protein [Acidobacteriota bacterium]